MTDQVGGERNLGVQGGLASAPRGCLGGHAIAEAVLFAEVLERLDQLVLFLVVRPETPSVFSQQKSKTKQKSKKRIAMMITEIGIIRTTKAMQC